MEWPPIIVKYELTNFQRLYQYTRVSLTNHKIIKMSQQFLWLKSQVSYQVFSIGLLLYNTKKNNLFIVHCFKFST